LPEFCGILRQNIANIGCHFIFLREKFEFLEKSNYLCTRTSQPALLGGQFKTYGSVGRRWLKKAAAQGHKKAKRALVEYFNDYE